MSLRRYLAAALTLAAIITLAVVPATIAAEHDDNNLSIIFEPPHNEYRVQYRTIDPPATVTYGTAGTLPAAAIVFDQMMAEAVRIDADLAEQHRAGNIAWFRIRPLPLV